MQCVSNRCKDLFKPKKYFGVRCTLSNSVSTWTHLNTKHGGLGAFETVMQTGLLNSFYNNNFIIIITLFESQIILAEHECCTNWGDCKSNKSNQIKCWFLRRGENRSSRRKTSRSRVENQQTQPTYDAGSGSRTRDTLVEGERSHHYTNPAHAPCSFLLRRSSLPSF